MAIKVIQWATGAKGAAILAEAIKDPRFDVVGCFVYSPQKDGVDIGTLAGLEPIGVKATNQREKIFALDADVVFHAPQLQATMVEHDQDVIRLLESGKNVISIMGYQNPESFGEDYASPLREACIRGGTTLFGTGIDPGFVSERLAIAITGLCTDIKTLEVLEHYNVSCAPALMTRTMGLGIPLDQFDEDKLGTMFEKFYGSMFKDVVERLGGQLDRFERSCETVLAEGPMSSNGMPFSVDKGDIVGSRWKWTVYSRGKPFFKFGLEWQLGDHIPGWAEKSGWTITIDGSPCIKTTLEVHSSLDKFASGLGEYNPEMMAACAINAVNEIIAAPPGFFKAPVFAPYQMSPA